MRRQAPQQGFDPRALVLDCSRRIYFEDLRTFGARNAICAGVEARSHDHDLVDAVRQRFFEGVIDEAGPNDNRDARTRPAAMDGLGHQSAGRRHPGQGEDRAEACAEQCVRVGIVEQALIGGKAGLERPKQRDELRGTARTPVRLRHPRSIAHVLGYFGIADDAWPLLRA
jgi:hypothetical protein